MAMNERGSERGNVSKRVALSINETRVFDFLCQRERERDGEREMEREREREGEMERERDGERERERDGETHLLS